MVTGILTDNSLVFLIRGTIYLRKEHILIDDPLTRISANKVVVPFHGYN